jgi:uncharacterized protein
MSVVHFTNLHTNPDYNLEEKFRKLFLKTGFSEGLTKGELVAIKLHVGERGNLAYVNHNYARVLVEEIRKTGAKPFLTDTNTLYSGGRHNGLDHTITAAMHGFSYATVGAPFIPADGLRGTDYTEIEVPGGVHLKKAKIATAILEADKILFLSHLKGHELAGFGASAKNMAMGCASVAGKQEQHSDAAPELDGSKCVGCRNCYRVCPVGAISMVDKKAVIDYEVCIGCGQCIAACNYDAMNPRWDTGHDRFMEKMAEYAWAVHHHFASRSCFINMAMDITPDCDCLPSNDQAIIEDIGMLAGLNPFALDRASLDLAAKARPLQGSAYADKVSGGANPFSQLYEKFDNEHLFSHLERLGGELEYELESFA